MRVMTTATTEADAASVFTQAAACLAARGGHGRLIGLSLTAAGERYLPAEEFGVALSRDYVDRIAASVAALNDTLKAAFHAAAAALPDAIAEWRPLDGDGSEQLGWLGRVADVIVLAQPNPEAPAEQDLLLQSALFESGRPVLMTPRGATAPSALRRALIAWNGSVETARAVAFALPWLQRCDSVRVFSCAAGPLQGPSAAEAAAYLADHGVAVSDRHLESDRGLGPASLAEAQDFGCDWMVKGAYTQSRLRQLIFGGATRHTLEKTTIPVMFAH